MSGCRVCIIMLITSTVKKMVRNATEEKRGFCYFVNNASHTFFLSPTF